MTTTTKSMMNSMSGQVTSTRKSRGADPQDLDQVTTALKKLQNVSQNNKCLWSGV
jgi:hypothetical protein